MYIYIIYIYIYICLCVCVCVCVCVDGHNMVLITVGTIQEWCLAILERICLVGCQRMMHMVESIGLRVNGVENDDKIPRRIEPRYTFL